jgi:hypothetical protein
MCRLRLAAEYARDSYRLTAQNKPRSRRWCRTVLKSVLTATLVHSRVCLTAPIFTSARACGHQALARTPSQATTHHIDDLAGSLGLSCVGGASLEETPR